MTIASGTTDILSIVNSKMGAAQTWLQTGQGPTAGIPGASKLSSSSGQSSNSDVLQLSSALAQLMGVNDSNLSQQTGQMNWNNTGILADPLTQILAFLGLAQKPKKTPSLAQQSNMAQFATVRPLEQEVKKNSSGDLSPMGSYAESDDTGDY